MRCLGKLFEKTVLLEKIKESFASVLPVTIITLLLVITICPVSAGMLLSFLAGAVLLILGMGLFSLGADMSMIPMGEYIGAQMTKSRKIWLVVFLSFMVGFMATICEPDLQVLAGYVPTVKPFVLTASVGLGVGIFLVLAMLRILFKIKLSLLLWICYVGVFIMALFVPQNYWAVAFDSGGVTTGPMTVPFIMALGVGVAASRSDGGADKDCFGLVALSSVGPISAVMILGLLVGGDINPGNLGSTEAITQSNQLILPFIKQLPHQLWEVLMALGPISGGFFLFHHLCARKPGNALTKRALHKILVGLGYTYIGLVLFLLGANIGFKPCGYELGVSLANPERGFWQLLIIPLGALVGYFIVQAEPAVHVLTKQVNSVTAGAIERKVVLRCLSIGVACSIALAMLRVLTGVSIMWFLIPGYSIALLLTIIVPSPFPSIAFDAGGVASGPMTAAFLLPFAMGACKAVGGNAATDAFGVVAFVAMTPLIAVQIPGLIWHIRNLTAKKTPAEVEFVPIDDDIIDL
ncbi:MAG: DUF1538 domain-containing protein [Clostridia bacterium]|nr:DUF1538 domain-containing protein [Clostridia bacterium]